MVMDKKKVGIIAECVCDLPKSTLRSLGVDILYFLVETENGVFTDTDEITADNVISHMESGGSKTKSAPPPPEVYKGIFEKNLKRFGEVILVAISSQISHSCENAAKAVELMGDEGKRVHVFDSEHLSTGLGFLVIRAAELANQGNTADNILAELDELKESVSTSFIAKNADYLYRNGLVSLNVKRVCSALNIHPILIMRKGKLVLDTVYIGNYDSASRFYVKRKLKGKNKVDSKQVFITHVGCSVKMLRSISSEVKKYCPFKKLEVTNASATISSNCGPGTFGVLFVGNK